MTEEEIKSFAASSGLSEQDQKNLLNATDREKEYETIEKWRRVREAEIDIYRARLALREQRIFMPETTTNEFSEAIERMSGAQVEKRLSLENPQIPSYDFGNASTEWLKDCTKVFEQLATSANARLFRQERQNES